MELQTGSPVDRETACGTTDRLPCGYRDSVWNYRQAALWIERQRVELQTGCPVDIETVCGARDRLPCGYRDSVWS